MMITLCMQFLFLAGHDSPFQLTSLVSPMSPCTCSLHWRTKWLFYILSKIRSLSRLSSVAYRWPLPCLPLSFHFLPLVPGYWISALLAPCWLFLKYLKHLDCHRASSLAFLSIWNALVLDKCIAPSLYLSPSTLPSLSKTKKAQTIKEKVDKPMYQNVKCMAHSNRKI